MKGQGRLDRHIIFESVLMLLAKNYQDSQCLSKLQLANVGAFLLRHSVLYRIDWRYWQPVFSA